jgi:hypothetical protein
MTREAYNRFLELESSMRAHGTQDEQLFAPLVENMSAYAVELFREFDVDLETFHPRMGPGACSDQAVSLPHDKYSMGTDPAESRFYDDGIPADDNWIGVVSKYGDRTGCCVLLPTAYESPTGSTQKVSVDVGEVPVAENIGLVPRLTIGVPYSSVDAERHDCSRRVTARNVQTSGSRLIAVPKDSTKMRTIAPEPVSKGMWQLAVNDRLKGYLEAHHSTSGHINFTHQNTNQQLALDHSAPRSVAIRKPRMRLASIDLSDASDRISWDLVKKVFPKKIVMLLSAVRSQYMWIPRSAGVKRPQRDYGITEYRAGATAVFETIHNCVDARKLAVARKMTNVRGNGNGRWIRLEKHASMGSGACFPVLAVIFLQPAPW